MKPVPTLRLRLGIALVSGLFFFVAPVWADTRYVIDELSVNMRKGMGTDYGINAVLKSGDRVTVLNDYDNQGYSRVRTADGKVGFILSRFLSRQATGSVRAERMVAQLEELKKKNAELEQALASTRTARTGAEEQIAELAQTRDKLQTRLDWIEEASADTVRIADENQKLRERVLAMESELTNLRQDNRELKSWHQGQKVGAFVLGIGLVVGWLLGRFRRSSSTWTSGGL